MLPIFSFYVLPCQCLLQKQSRRGFKVPQRVSIAFRSLYLFAVVKALEVIVTLLNALVGLISKSIALAELLPCGVASAAS